MFGIGFTELLLISIIAILFLGPDKLPKALIDMAKFIKKIKITVGDAKSTLEEEFKIADLKEEALSYKKQLDEATDELKHFKNVDFDDFDDVSYDEEISKESPKALASQPKAQEVKKDPYAQAPRSVPEESAVNTTQVEAKNDTVTFKKKEKIVKNDTETSSIPKTIVKETKGDA